VAPGERARQATIVGPLADRGTTERIGGLARQAGASTYAATLTTLAAAVRDLGGPEILETLVPVSTRSGKEARRAIGWYTTTVLVTVPADLTAAGIRTTGAAVRRGVRLGEVPLDQVIASLPRPPGQTRRDVFMVSWLDYRRLPGGAHARARAATHVSATTLADDLQLWVSRTEDGLATRARLPETEKARALVGELLAAWQGRLHGLTSG
jgi:mycolipenoyl-CoA---2-(long-chain-fatty acyl)-trehalose mycolipenoyltransferase / long-chain-acyl-CoA---trehalose acyltransferase